LDLTEKMPACNQAIFKGYFKKNAGDCSLAVVSGCKGTVSIAATD